MTVPPIRQTMTQEEAQIEKMLNLIELRIAKIESLIPIPTKTPHKNERSKSLLESLEDTIKQYSNLPSEIQKSLAKIYSLQTAHAIPSAIKTEILDSYKDSLNDGVSDLERISELAYVVDLPFELKRMELPSVQGKERILELNQQFLLMLKDWNTVVDAYNQKVLKRLN